MSGEHRPGEVGTGSPSGAGGANQTSGRERAQGRATKKNKPPVIMIHGGFCGPWAWDDFAARFRNAGYKVETPALRHHDGGKPPAALATTSLADYAADLEKLIGKMKTPPILVGHSMGGLLAQMLAARCDVAAALLLAPSAPWGVPPSTLFEIGAAQSLMLRVGFWSMILGAQYSISPRPIRWTASPRIKGGSCSRNSCPNPGAPPSRSCIGVLIWGGPVKWMS